MDLSMQQRDALLAGLSLLREAIQQGKVSCFDPSDPEGNELADMLTNGGNHAGLSEAECGALADLIVEEYPNPPIAQGKQWRKATDADIDAAVEVRWQADDGSWKYPKGVHASNLLHFQTSRCEVATP